MKAEKVMQKKSKMMQTWSQNGSQNQLKSGKIRKKGMRNIKRKFDAEKGAARNPEKPILVDPGSVFGRSGGKGAGRY